MLIDPHAIYLAACAAFTPAHAVIHVTRDEWRAEVEGPMADLPAGQARVPADGHYGPGTHMLIADLILRRIGRR